jgi:signal transduction histidine kinase
VESVGVNLLGVPAVDGIVVTTRPITERKAAEEALKIANRQLNLLTSSTRHNVLNKITAVLGYLRLATLKNPDAGTADLIAKADAEVEAIRTQIAFTAVYNDQGTHEPVWQDPAALIAALPVPEAVILKNILRNVQIQADPMLVRVFENFLDNSLRHGGHVTRITVSSAEEDGVLKIRWEDNGVGVPAGEKEKIFKQGYGRHTGLGLFLVREILSLTGMTVRENGEPGKGARFEIIVPQDRFRAINRTIVP